MTLSWKPVDENKVSLPQRVQIIHRHYPAELWSCCPHLVWGILIPALALTRALEMTTPKIPSLSNGQES